MEINGSVGWVRDSWLKSDPPPYGREHCLTRFTSWRDLKIRSKCLHIHIHRFGDYISEHLLAQSVQMRTVGSSSCCTFSFRVIVVEHVEPIGLLLCHRFDQFSRKLIKVNQRNVLLCGDFA